MKSTAQNNTSCNEIKFLGQMMDEAINHGYCDKNPARRLHIERTPSKGRGPVEHPSLVVFVQAPTI